MRRIPRSSRSIDPSIPSSSMIASRVPSSHVCRSALTSSPLARTTTACFSTTSRYNILGGTQDKKKHQAFVRKWQKRLLGDSEPIGAHVDPYDATSPVRISPEETGEEVETIEESASESYGAPYRPAKTGEGLTKVGGKEWIQEREEELLLRRFNILVAPQGHTYGEIVNYDFAPQEKVKRFKELQALFHQAVVEVFTLKQSGKKIAFPQFANIDPAWTRNVKLHASPAGSVVLSNVQPEDVEQFLAAVEDPAAQIAEAVDELVIDEAFESTAEAVEEAVPELDVAKEGKKASPAAKKTEGNPFDFMSNRPVSRVKPDEPVPEVEQIVETTEAPQGLAFIESAHQALDKELSSHRHDILFAAANTSERTIAALRKSVHGTVSPSVLESTIEAKYGGIALNDLAVKFAITKRILQLTGHRIPDPTFNSAKNLGDLFSALVSASRPKPTTVRDALKHEAKLQHIRSKHGKNKKSASPSTSSSNNRNAAQKPTLAALPNVRFQGKRISPVQKEKEVGRWKVIEYALAERDLPRLSKDA
ncbi:hypothetical protein BU24DRAFT_489614 [Aaosphaeria arxii CBS 175.79]|uniref:Large ribosomal subunit protein mL50 n=1 Tax=Aaosphaeria arxii CBS 175.79 TaxID=1450172 RepID=A0A6A5Y3V7_9PLEO|nr:uncharacterized protein BU24DRAFT_489614 [Aaosphaeria arxii CBS 175.79]KAF2019707.1 hypothetical protein BU24DRAFT_489614 [Aaosphaeria arxii CBS 175.79]